MMEHVSREASRGDPDKVRLTDVAYDNEQIGRRDFRQVAVLIAQRHNSFQNTSQLQRSGVQTDKTGNPLVTGGASCDGSHSRCALV